MNKVNNRNKWSLSVGCIGRDVCYTLVSLFLLTYLQYTGLFSTSQFLVITVIIILCRIWDAFNDPMMGTIIANTHSRFGKYRPWVLIGAITNAITLVLMFSVRFDNQSWGNVVFIGIMYLLWGMTFTMNDISYWDLLPALTSDKKERDNLTTLVAVFASVGAFAAGGLVPILTPGNMIVMYRYISIIAAVVFLLCQLLVFFGVHDNEQDAFKLPKESVDKETNEEEKITFKKMIKILVSNKQLLVMAGVILLYSLGSSILNAFGQNFFYFRFGYLSGKGTNLSGGTMMTIFTVIYAVGTLISQAVYPMLANKWKRDQLVTVSMISLIFGYVAFFVFANLTMLPNMVDFIILCVIGLFIFAGQGVFYLTMLIMLTNTIEYGEWETGKNNSAITFTIRPFMVKLASALEYGIVALTLVVCGLYSTTNKVGDVEIALGKYGEDKNFDYLSFLSESNNKHEASEVSKYMLENATHEDAVGDGLRAYANSLFHAQTGSMIGLTASMCVFPIVLFIVSWVFIKKWYVIDEETYDKICNEIAERKVKE